jgi:lipid-A-disaccharide synthase
VPTVANAADAVAAAVCGWSGRPIVLRAMKSNMTLCREPAALAASGTVALELALARLPMIVAYRLSPLTQMVLDRVVKVRQVNLINLILEQRLVPEFLGPDCTPEKLAAALVPLIRDERVRAGHLRGYDE